MIVKKNQRIIALAIALLMVLQILPVSLLAVKAADNTVTHTLDATKDLAAMAQGAKADGDTLLVNGYFTIHFSAKNKIDGSSKEFTDGYSGTQRLNFGGKTDFGPPIKNAIQFTTSSAATVKVWWAAAGDGREFAIYDSDGNILNETNEQSIKNSSYLSELTIETAGTYYLGVPDGSNYLFKLEVTEGATGSGEGGGSTTETTAPTEETTAPTEETTAPTESTGPATTQIHNFTTDGMESAFFTISGNLSDSKGEVSYDGLTLTRCLKMESSTNISFNAPEDGTLTLVFGGSTSAEGKEVKIDGEKITVDSTQILTVAVTSGEHTVTKGYSINLFYMVYTPASAAAGGEGGGEGGDPNESQPSQPEGSEPVGTTPEGSEPVGTTPEGTTPEGGDDQPHTLDATKDLEAMAQGAKADGDTELVNNYFTIHFSAKNKIDGSKKEFSDGYTATQRLNFGGKTTKELYNTVEFTTTGAVTVKIWWVSGGADRTFAIYDASGNIVCQTEAPTDSNLLFISTLTLDDAGTYYLGVPVGSNYLFRLDVSPKVEEEPGEGTDPSEPEGTTPEGTTPEGTTPEGTTPEGTTPEGTTPEGTTPEGTTPEGTTPEGTTPEGTDPEGTTPEGEQQAHTLDATKDLEAMEKGAKNDGDTLLVNGYFTIHFSAKNKIDGSNKEFSDGYTATQRLNFGGKTTKELYNTVEFTTTGAVTVKIWWVSGGADRTFAIYDASGNIVCQTEAPTDSNLLFISTLTLDAAGTYYLGVPTGSNYLFRLDVSPKVEEEPGEGTDPSEPEASEPKPTEPEVTEPKPTEPEVTEPKPTEPKPTVPEDDDTVYVDKTFVLDVTKDIKPFISGSKAAGETISLHDFFTIICGAKTKVDSSSKVFSDGYSAGFRLNFQDPTDEAMNCTVKFTTEGAATIKIWWVSGGDGRSFAIYDENGQIVTRTTDESVKNSLYISTLELSAAGTYYLGVPEGSNNLFRMDVTTKVPAESGEGEQPGDTTDPTEGEDEDDETVLDISSDLDPFEVGSKADGETMVIGDFFTLHLSAKSKVESKVKTFPDGYIGTQRFSLGGKTEVENGMLNSVEFNAEGATTVKIWWVGGGEGRYIAIYDANGNIVASTELCEEKDDLHISELTLTAGGKYYIGMPEGNNYLFRINVDAAEVTEPDATEPVAPPATGDSSALSLVVALLAISFTALAILPRKKDF